MKRTFQPKNTKRKRKYGFKKKMESPGGKRVLSARRRKGRKRIAVTAYKK